MYAIDVNYLINPIEEQDFKTFYSINDEIDMAHFIAKLKKYFNNSHICYINNDLIWNETNYNTISKVMIRRALINDINSLIDIKNISIIFVVPTDNKIFNKVVIDIHYSYITVSRYI